VSENSAKANDDLLTAQEKVDHLNNIKTKLEQTLDDLESSLSREKRQRAQIEKERRKVEGDLKVTQEMVLDLERTKKELESIIQRKEKDISGLFVKLEDEQSLVAKVQKHIKENQSRYLL
jgi:myosin heavy chain 6/7